MKVHRYESDYTQPFFGVILREAGQTWHPVPPEDLRGEVLEGLMDELGFIDDGATAMVGGLTYRAVIAK